jgi:hemoglobin-like flavoprotein
MSTGCCPFSAKNLIRIHITDHPEHDKYHIERADPTEDDVRIATTSWFRILSRSAEGFLAATEGEATADRAELSHAERGYSAPCAELTPVVFFYDTFFAIWRTKSVFVLDQIYRNNIKLKSSSMIAMVGYILHCKKHSDAEIEAMVQRHSAMGVSRAHYSLMAEVIIETIQKVLKITDADDAVIVAWRRIVSWMIERVDAVFRKSNRWKGAV